MDLFVTLCWLMAAIAALLCVFNVASRWSIGWVCALFIIITQLAPRLPATFN